MQAHETAAIIAQSLGNARREGAAWRCLCPIHGGSSLVVRDGHSALLVKCWSGCASEDILVALRRRGMIDEGQVARPASCPPQHSRMAEEDADRLKLARYLFSLALPVERSPAATRYFREARAYDGPISPTIRYLPARDGHKHAIVCAYGFPAEIEPGALHLTDEAVRGIHLIKLNSDGSDRHRSGEYDPDPAKVTIGRCMGWPIVCGPFAECSNALVITEGVEDALTQYAAMGIGAWAAGGASRMPSLAASVPDYVDCVSICVDNNEAGRNHSAAFARLMQERGIEVRLIQPFEFGSDAR
jgi:Toprim domain